MKKLALVCALAAWLMIFAPARAEAPKPGDTPSPTAAPAQESYRISMEAQMVFPHPAAAAQANLANPANSGYDMRYTLLLMPGELERVTGLAADDSGELVLFRSGLVKPGESIPTIRLDPLPGGAMLSEGTYKAYILVEPFDAVTGEPSTKIFRVENAVRIMADEREANAAENGAVGLQIYNNTDAAARYALVLSAEELREVAGIALDASGRLSERDTMIELWRSGEIEAYEILAESPVVSGLPAGEYCAYLIRISSGEAPTGCSRIQLNIKVLNGNQIFEIPDIGEERAIEYAQAVVNCEYLLSMDVDS